MTPSEFDEYLAIAQARGCLEANISFVDGKHLSFKLTPAVDVAPAAPFVDAQGKPVSLDDGAPWNARDPAGERDPLIDANFPPKAE